VVILHCPVVSLLVKFFLLAVTVDLATQCLAGFIIGGSFAGIAALAHVRFSYFAGIVKPISDTTYLCCAKRGIAPGFT
jgi:hypothetical protein